MVILAESVTALLVIVEPRDDSKCDEVDVLPILEAKLAELPQGCRTCEDKFIARPEMLLVVEIGTARSKGWVRNVMLSGAIRLGTAPKNNTVSGQEVVP